MERLLVDIGSDIAVDDDQVTINTPQIVSPEAPYELVKTMRASSLVLGRWWRAPAARASLCPAAAPSEPGPSTCICWASNTSAHRSPGARLH